MPARILFVLVATFWVLMNVLLWRAEFGRGRETLSELSLTTVVDRILNAPDPSVLQIRHQGQPVGSLRWIPTVEELSRPDSATGPGSPEGMVDAAGYNLDLDLSLVASADALQRRLRVLAHVDLDTNYVWQNVSLRVFQRPATWEISARAGDDAVRIRYEEGATRWEQSFRPKDLEQWQELLGPYAKLIPTTWMGDLQALARSPGPDTLRWSAQSDWLRVGRNRIRTYRVEATLLKQYTAVIHLSRAGEILFARFPDGLQLANESLPFGFRD
jgi:hypothetical protein